MSSFAIIASVLATGFAAWRAGRRMRFFLHRMQLSGYKRAAFGASLRGPVFDLKMRASHVIGLALLALFAFVGSALPHAIVWLSLSWAVAFASSRRYRRDRTKKPPVWTPRMKRLTVVATLFGVVILVVAAIVGLQASTLQGILVWLAAWWLVDFGAFIWVSVASRIMKPFEARIHEGFKRQARAHLALRPDLTCVAITGSYGKTSVKFAVRDVLTQRFPVLATPGSFNTPMGVSKVINQDLTDDHRFLVLEMGIRHRGDIAELVDIARPDIAVITSIGVAHLESMGSIEAIAAEKLSLMDGLPGGGTAVVNGDDDRVLDGARAKVEAHSASEGLKLIVVSTTAGKGDCWAENIRYGPGGARFDVVLVSGECASVETALLGRHNVLNILLAIGVGLAAGMKLRQAVRGADRMKPVPHRLSMRTERGLTIIDDAFNSNPVGAANAVEVLAAMNGRRVIVTPGMIELGEQEAALNTAFGAQIAAGADDVLLVGPKRTTPIREGLIEAGFPDDRIHPVYTLFEAREWIAQHCELGDTVLYENDLPDQFTETRP